MTREIFWIPGPWPGRLAAVARPRGGDWLEDEALCWRAADFNMIVSLLENQEAGELGLNSESDAAKSADIQFVSFPIPDRGVPESTHKAVSCLGA